MIKAKKKFGQNFLTNPKISNTIIKSANLNKNDVVLEIGAGTGILTQKAASEVQKLYTVEIDQDLIPLLKVNLKNSENVEILNRDILQIEIGKYNKNKNLKILGSIPFQITSPLLHKLIEENCWEVAVLLIQKEVADKITAKPPQANYLSIFTATYVNANKIKNVPRTAFEPQPQVDGAVVKLEPIERTTINPQKWGTFLHLGFKQPRKMLRNIFPETQLRKAEIEPQARPQQLTIDNWLDLYQTVENISRS